MNKETIRGLNGYDIPGLNNLSGGERMAVIVRPLKINREFYDDLEAHHVFKVCWPYMAELAMIHGDADETVSVVDERRFANQFGARLTEVKGADHRFRIPGGKEQVIDSAVQFFNTK